MEFEKEWLEISKRLIDSFEKMVAMEEKQREFMSKPIEPVSITPISKFATPDTVKEWHHELKNVRARIVEYKNTTLLGVIMNVINGMEKYIDEI